MNLDERTLLIRIDERVKTLLEGQIATKDQHEELELRVRRLEKFRNWAVGAGATISAFFSYLFYPQH